MPKPKWYAVCDKTTGRPISFCTDDSQGFDLTKLNKTFSVNPVARQPIGQEIYDPLLKVIKSKDGVPIPID